MLIDGLKLHLENTRFEDRDKILFFQDLSSQIPFSSILLFLWALQEFQQDLSHQHIANPVSNFLMKMHGHIGLFTYPSFSKYSLRRLYHMRLDCFNSYKDRCNFIEYMLWGFLIFASDNLNPSRIFMYVSLSIIHINML